MNTKDLTLSQTEIHKLLSAGSGDAALLHLYLQCGNAPPGGGGSLGDEPGPVLLRRRYPSAAGPLAGGERLSPPGPAGPPSTPRRT